MGRKKGKIDINTAKKKDVLRVYKQLTEENAGKSRPFKVPEKVAKLMGVCPKTVRNIVKEAQTGEYYGPAVKNF